MLNKVKNKVSKKFISMLMKVKLPSYKDDEIIQIYNECKERIQNNIFDEVNTKEWCEILRPLIKDEMKKRDLLYVDF